MFQISKQLVHYNLFSQVCVCVFSFFTIVLLIFALESLHLHHFSRHSAHIVRSPVYENPPWLRRGEVLH